MCLQIILEHKRDYLTAMLMVRNMRRTFKKMAWKERYSGVKAGVLQTVVDDDSAVLPISRALKVFLWGVPSGNNTVVDPHCCTGAPKINKKSKAAKSSMECSTRLHQNSEESLHHQKQKTSEL